MFERFWTVSVIVAMLVLGASSALAGGKGFYAGAQLGYGENDDFVSANDDGSLSGINEDTDDLSYKVYGGYNFNSHVGVEAGYSDYGDTSFDATSDGSGNSWVAGDVATDFEANGYGANVVGRLPIGDRWTLFASAGIFSWDTTESFTENGVVTEVDKNSGTDATYGVGAEYDIGNPDDVVIRAEYSTVDVDDDGDQIQAVQVGARWTF